MIGIIANLGFNWYAKKPAKRALQLAEKAIESGATYIVVPYMRANKLFSEDQLISAAKIYEIDDVVVKDLVQLADSNDTMLFLNPRHPEAVALGEKLDVDGYHIANGDLGYIDLLSEIANTKKPIFLSTGFTLISEISGAVDFLVGKDEYYRSQIVLFHSTGGTPTIAKDSNLTRILKLMSEFFPMSVGLESFYYDDFLDYVAMGYPDLWGIMRRIDLGDEIGLEHKYSITPAQLTKLAYVAGEMEAVMNVNYVDDTGLTQTDIDARRRLMRLDRDDFLLPPSCCPDGD